MKAARTMPVIGAPLSVATGAWMRMAPLRAATSNSQPMQMIMKPCFSRKPSPTRFCPAVRFKRNAVVFPRIFGIDHEVRLARDLLVVVLGDVLWRGGLDADDLRVRGHGKQARRQREGRDFHGAIVDEKAPPQRTQTTRRKGLPTAED